MNPSRHIELDIDIGADARDWSAIQAQEKLKPVETDLRRIEELVNEIVSEMDYLRTREQKLRDTNESTNERVKWFAFGTMGMLVGLGAWQVVYLRAYFRYVMSDPYSKNATDTYTAALSILSRQRDFLQQTCKSVCLWLFKWQKLFSRIPYYILRKCPIALGSLQRVIRLTLKSFCYLTPAAATPMSCISRGAYADERSIGLTVGQLQPE